MKFAVALGVLGALQVFAAWSIGAAGIPVAWSGVAWIAVGAGYGGLGPRVFGKRTDGSMSRANALALFPYLLFTWAVWYVGRRPGSACGQEIAPGLWLGRRPLDGELPSNVCAVVDLTSEFPKSSAVGDRAYLCHPLLDAMAPDADSLRRLVSWIEAQSEPVYVHCAAGHGRSATVVAAVLVARGLARDVDEAVATIQRARPRARLNRSQRISVEEFARLS